MMVRLRRYKILDFPLDCWDVQGVISYLQAESRNTDQLNLIFQKAIKTKDYLMIQMLLWNRVKIEALNDSNQTAIHLAAARGYVEIIDRLFRHCNNDVNHADVDGFTHFHIACITGNTEIVEQFVKNGVNVNLRFRARSHDERNDFTPLHFAVKHAKLEVVELLLKSHADANARDFAGRTPLHHACGFHATEAVGCTRERSVLEIVKLLIGRGADVNARDRNGEMPLCRVFHDGSTSYTEKLLLRYSTDFMIYSGVLCKTKRRIIQQLRGVQAQKLKLLLESGVDVDARIGGAGDTVLHRVVGDLKTTRELKEFGVLCFEDACHAQMVQEILRRGVDVDAKNDWGETPLSVASSLLSADVVRVLLRHGADVRAIKFEYFHYPKILPCLKAVENLLDIVAMREQRRHPLSQAENLAVIKFFVCNNERCKYTDSEDVNAVYKLRNLLEFGTAGNVVTSLDKTVQESFHSQRMLSCEIGSYLVKLQNSGLRTSESVDRCLRRIRATSESAEISDRHLKEMQAEAEKIKSSKLINGKSLTEILTLPSSELYSLLKSSEHKQAFNLFFDLPHNSHIVQGYFARCLTRRFVRTAANDFMRCLIGAPLPDPCCERISSYLSNEELLNLCLASMIKLPKNQTATIKSTPA